VGEHVKAGIVEQLGRRPTDIVVRRRVDHKVVRPAPARRAHDHGYGFDETPELPFDWNANAFAKLTRLQLYADRRVAAATSAAYNAEWTWGQNTKYNDPDDSEFYERQQRFDNAEYELLALIREALFDNGGRSQLALPAIRPARA
jgi:hypothetical protein